MNPEDEKLISDISEFFHDKGYNTGNSDGIMGAEGRETCIGILGQRKKLLNMKHLKIESPVKSEYFASLYLNPDQELDKIDKEWAFIVYGKNNNGKFDNILKELEEKYKVHIQKYINPQQHKEYDAIL